VTWQERALRPGWEIWQRPDDVEPPFLKHIAIALDGNVRHRIVYDDHIRDDIIARDLIDQLKKLGAFRERYEPS
jgi:hypothetical protein